MHASYYVCMYIAAISMVHSVTARLRLVQKIESELVLTLHQHKYKSPKYLCTFSFRLLYKFIFSLKFLERSVARLGWPLRRMTSAASWAQPPKLQRSWRRSHQGEGVGDGDDRAKGWHVGR